MFTKRPALLVSAACAAALLGGCSGASSGPPIASLPSASGSSAVRHGWILPAATHKKLLYVTDYTSSIVLIYEQGDTGAGPVGEIVTGVDNPEGDAVDSQGTLYVANNGNGTVTEYPKGSTTPGMTLSSGIADPLDVSVDSNGTVYVAEYSANSIVEFTKGSTTPSATVSLTHPSDVTNARNNDLYVTYNDKGGHVARCKPLATKCRKLGISVSLAQGIAIDLQGNLLVGDYYTGEIYIYQPSQTTPFREIATAYEQPKKLALDKTDATLYQADPANFAVELYNYEAGTLESSFTFGSADELEGVALSPGQKPGK